MTANQVEIEFNEGPRSETEPTFWFGEKPYEVFFHAPKEMVGAAPSYEVDILEVSGKQHTGHYFTKFLHVLNVEDNCVIKMEIIPLKSQARALGGSLKGKIFATMTHLPQSKDFYVAFTIKCDK